MMPVYIAFLRGINVGGKNVIKVADLKRTFESLGLNRVQTYIQSGNVLFESNEEEEPLHDRIERNLEALLHIPITVILRTAGELELPVKNLPFSEEEISRAESAAAGVESLYVALLERSPSQEECARLDAYGSQTDECRVIGREVFLLFHHSIRDSKLANNLHRLDMRMTVRNWKTMKKLVELASAMASV